MERPKLRKIERIALDRKHEPLVVLRDPLGLREPTAVDADLSPVLDMLDGNRTVAQIRQSLLLRGILDISTDQLQALVDALAQDGWLENDAFRDAWQREHASFMAADERPGRLADLAYPADLDRLRRQIEQALPARDDRCVAGSRVSGVVCPHAPFDLVGDVLDRTLRGLPRASDLDYIVVLGTDHHPGLLPFATTAKHYATPLGRVTVADTVVRDLVRMLPWLITEEIRHKEAWSIELAALQLRCVYGDACPPIVPILCSQTAIVSRDGATAAERFLATMEALAERSRVLFWASAEFSHAGPAYGHPELSLAAIDDVRERDLRCLDALAAGRPDQFLSRCMEPHPQGRPSGAPAVTALLRILPVGYAVEFAAYENTSVPGPQHGQMGLAGVRFSSP